MNISINNSNEPGYSLSSRNHSLPLLKITHSPKYEQNHSIPEEISIIHEMPEFKYVTMK